MVGSHIGHCAHMAKSADVVLLVFTWHSVLMKRGKEGFVWPRGLRVMHEVYIGTTRLVLEMR